MATDNKYKNNLPKFLETHKRKDGEDFTHTVIGNTTHGVYGGSYNIPEQDTTEFFDLYYRYVFKDGKSAYLTEKHRENGPIVIDLDLRMPGDSGRTYNDATVMTFLDIVNKELYNLISPTKALCQAFVMEKSAARYDQEKNITKDGLHIMYPYIVVDPNVQFALRYNVIMNPSCAKIFKDIGVSNPIDDIYDKCVIDRNNWQMYGSGKPGGEPYQLTKRYSFEMEEITKKITHKEKIRTLSVRYFDTKYCYKPSEEEVSKIEELNSKMPDEQKAKKKKMNNLKRVKSPMNKIRATDEDYKMARELVPILSDHRAHEYEPWIQLGFCLHNIDYRLLEDWDTFSKRSFKYQEGGCRTEWVSMSNEGLGLGSLCRWAKQDNIVEFTRISSKNLKQLLIASLSMTHTDIGRVIYHEFKNEFVCSALRKQEWYQFKNHRWRRTDSAVALRKYISNSVVNLYMKFQTECNNEAVELDSSSTMKEILIERSNKIGKLIVQLKKTSFKKSLIDECAEMFYVEKFEEELDANLDLICFENGVYDLERGEFREGFAEDKLSFTTGIYYRDFEEDEEELIEVKTFMEQVLPIKPVRDYMFRLLSSFVSGRVKEQKFHIWTGCHARGTGIINSEGSVVKVEDIEVGDKLMGPDSKPRLVKSLVRGSSDMYRITPSKGEEFVVNGGHIMVLKATKIGSVTDFPKENRVKASWQERDENGYPVNKCANFPYISPTRKVQRKSVKYYASKNEALKAAKKYKERTYQEPNVIKNGDVIEIPLVEYLARRDKIGRRNYYLFKTGISYESRDVDMDPYVLGYWLGDGNSHNMGITTMDDEIVEYFDDVFSDLDKKVYSKRNNLAKTINYSSYEKTKGKNRALNVLKKYNLVNNKHIPSAFSINSREIRMEILAGIIDSDGHYNSKSNQYEITLKNEKLTRDILSLTRSLGFAATMKPRNKKCHNNGKVGTYYQVVFYGEECYDIPVKLTRKKARERKIIKDPLRYSFSVSSEGVDDYYGFQLTGDHLYLAEDYMVHHNCGGNGKSKLIELFRMGFGDYCCTLPVSLITQKRGRAEGATPALAQTKGKRFACFQEPEGDESINVGLMKELSGSDTIMARGLHKDPIEFKPQFKMVLTCNVLPEINASDRGTWRRVRAVEFKSVFTDQPDPNDEFQFQIDEQLDDKMNTWKEPFMFLLFKEHIKYKSQGISEPEDVMKFTKQYQNDSDNFTQFFDECIVESAEYSDSKGDCVSLNEMYQLYTEWFAQNKGTQTAPPKKRDLNTHAIKKYGAATSKKWFGIKLKDINDNDDDTLDDI